MEEFDRGSWLGKDEFCSKQVKLQVSDWLEDRMSLAVKLLLVPRRWDIVILEAFFTTRITHPFIRHPNSTFRLKECLV